MPISRDPRLDRRRRVLRETVDGEPTSEMAAQRARRARQEQTSETGGRRRAGYSQDVRNACGHRLVQLIPIRRRSYLAAIVVSVLLPSLLLLAHYMVYVSGSWPWYGHPLAVALDASHPQGVAAWFSSHLWLLCLGATLLTFQLRRHKLDDYNGEYRLWFWLVVTCLLASLESTTHVSELFGLSLDRWSQAQLGWSGPAVVRATMAVLIGMLGIRLCGELKSVPLSLIFWLGGLVAWAGSAALAQPELQLEMSVQHRIWMRCALWLGGLSAVWLAALTYLRSVYVEAQHRFLLRGHLAGNLGVPLRQRLREALPRWPSMARAAEAEANAAAAGTADAEGKSQRGGLRRWLRRPGTADTAEVAGSAVATKRAAKQLAASTAATVDARNKAPAEPATKSPPPPAKRVELEENESTADEAGKRRMAGFWRARKDRPRDSNSSTSTSADSQPTTSWFSLRGWLRKAKDNDEAEEYRKVRAEQRAEQREEAKRQRAAKKAARSTPAATDAGDDEDASGEAPRRRWIPKLSRPKLPKVPRLGLPKVARPKLGGWLPKLKMPSLGLSALRLRPPEDEAPSDQPKSLRAVSPSRPLPGTSQSVDDASEGEGDNNRPMTKAERKRLRRMQQQHDRAA